MSVYNGEKYLREAIESILNQTFSNFEFIIINDKSSDRTWEILEGWSKKDPRIKIARNKKNIGLTKSLNKALKIARGEYIARQDVDDISLFGRLEKELCFLEENKEYGLVGTAFMEIDKGKKLIGKLGRQRTKLLRDDQNIRRNIIKFNPFCHSSVMFRKEVIEKVGGYNEKFLYAQDYEFWIRIIKYYKVANLQEVLVYKRYFSNMISNAYLRKQSLYAIKAKIFGIKTLGFPVYNYLYLYKDIIRFMLPLSARKFIRYIKWDVLRKKCAI